MELAIAGERPDVDLDRGRVVLIDYINYRGERGIRRIIPERCYLDQVSWHPGRQWILDAWDLDKNAIRSFAIADIQRWGV